MPFNQANPTDNEKIRRLGIVIRPNWKALEEGSQDDANPNKLKFWGINYYARDDIPAAPGNDAPQVDDGIVVYAKTDSDTGFPELFTRHEDSTVTQVTKGPANIAPAMRTDNGETSLYGGLLMKYALVDTGGTGSGDTAYTWQGTASSTELGLTDFPNNCFNVQITGYYVPGGTVSDDSFIIAYSTSGFTIRKSGSSPDKYFVVAIGN